jgi:hypothetical protein
MRHQIDTRAAGEPTSCGDFAEHLYLDSHRSAIFVGDVAGRGHSVGRAADALRAYTRSAILNGTSLSDTLDAVDDFFARTAQSEAVPFASLFIAVSDGRKAQLRYASAGHEPGLLFDEAGRAVQNAQLSLFDTADAIHQAAVEHARGALVDDASVVVSAFGVHRNAPTPSMLARPLSGWATLTKAEHKRGTYCA